MSEGDGRSAPIMFPEQDLFPAAVYWQGASCRPGVSAGGSIQSAWRHDLRQCFSSSSSPGEGGILVSIALQLERLSVRFRVTLGTLLALVVSVAFFNGCT